MASDGTSPLTNSDDPLEAVRENREAVEQLALEYRADNLDAAARIALSLADGERPDYHDLKAWGIAGGEDFGMATQPPAGVSTSPEVVEVVERVLKQINP